MTETENMNGNKNQQMTVKVTEASFGAEVLQSKQPVLVEFRAPWSLPCRVLDPILDEIAGALSSRIKVVKIDADDSPDLSLLYDIHSIPTILYFVEGEPRFRMVGTASKEAILAKLRPFGAPASELPSRQTR